MALQIDIQLKRPSKVYHESENIVGVTYFECPHEYKHDGISLTMEGVVSLKLSAKNIHLLEAFSNSVKPILLAHSIVEISPAGKIPAGKTEVVFEIPLVPRQNRTLYETYHGVYIYIQYKLKLEVRKSLLTKSVSKEIEFLVEHGKKNYLGDQNLSTRIKESAIKFTMNPQSIQKIYTSTSSIPSFEIDGNLYGTICDINKPFTGELVIKNKDCRLKHIELQLSRVETCGCSAGYGRDSSEIQNIQIAEGDVPIDVKIPIYMIFPRRFACPSLTTSNFKIEFELNVMVVFEDKDIINENFPLQLLRL